MTRLLLPEAIHDEVVNRLVARAQSIKVGGPTEAGVQMGPLISDTQCKRVQAHVDRALDDGAKLVTGGGRPAPLEKGFYFEPTILTEVTPEATIAQEEVFGPGGAPFGGFKQSGFGRESGGIVGIRQYMEPKAMGLPT